ncbi:MAG: hypothetical protein H6742_04015 [Alphaproteobacteria bacterium]|nr:hypothetical protein [Alphaproteobacteria bacterium]
MPLSALLLAAALTAPASASGELDLSVGGGSVLTHPAAGIGVEATGRSGVLRLSGAADLWGRGDHPVGAPPIPAATTSIELGLDFHLGRRGRARLGPFGGVDGAWMASKENSCSMGWGCKFWNFVDMDPLGFAFDFFGGVAWTTNAAEPRRPGFDLSLALQPAASYDMVWPVLRTELAVRTGKGWWIGAELSRFQGTGRLGKRW